MRQFNDHLIQSGSIIKEALLRLNILGQDAILFVVDADEKLIGALTDGDVRRGLLKGFSIDNKVEEIIQPNPRYIRKSEFDINRIIEYRESNFRIVPVLDNDDVVVNVLNFRTVFSYLPVDAVLMAGGKGQRLMPLTADKPKPLLPVGDKPIIDHNISRLSYFGIYDFWISVKYLGEQIESYFGNGNTRNINIRYVWEDEPLGTIGAVSKIKDFRHEYVLVSNSDILTNLDYEHFFLDFLQQQADMSVVTIPYQVNVPYAVLETVNGRVHDFKEKPVYTYYSNGGIYFIRRDILKLLPADSFFNATDLMELLIKENYKVVSYPLSGYWLDIGSPNEYERAQIDVKNIKF